MYTLIAFPVYWQRQFWFSNKLCIGQSCTLRTRFTWQSVYGHVEGMIESL